MSRWLIVLAVALTALVSASSSATAAPRQCPSLAYTPMTGELIYGIQADGVACEETPALFGTDALNGRGAWYCTVDQRDAEASLGCVRDDGARLAASFGDGCCDFEVAPTTQPYRPGSATLPDRGDRACPSFVVGRANSTAYDDLRLPAAGAVRKVPCARLRSLARAVQSGGARVPRGAKRMAPSWGRSFAVEHRGERWRCRYQGIGSSGPSYAVSCTRGASGSVGARWTTG